MDAMTQSNRQTLDQISRLQCEAGCRVSTEDFLDVHLLSLRLPLPRG